MRKTVVLYSNLWATVFMLVMFLISGLSGSRVPGSGTTSGLQHLKGRVIVLDPGHGGGDPGTVGVGPTPEAENVLAIAWELKSMLEKAGAEVILTRQNDSSPAWGTIYAAQENGQLAARVAAANRSRGQVFLSLHNDWHEESSVRGSSTHYFKSADLALAEALQRSLVSRLRTADLGVKRSSFYVLRNTSMPAALVEIGFLSNPEEAARLSQPTYRLEVARALLMGLNDYFALF
ncbi:MAG TPA: N-acetylmuramoyl-L-alanine amidase [Firmicutes bacterium]|nr:N-acetylmuramoyl-L-alanine amidase [Bacillota bacterium]